MLLLLHSPLKPRRRSKPPAVTDDILWQHYLDCGSVAMTAHLTGLGRETVRRRLKATETEERKLQQQGRPEKAEKPTSTERSRKSRKKKASDESDPSPETPGSQPQE